MSLIRQITDAEFDELVVDSKLPVLLFCTSPECIICKTMKERLNELIKSFKGKVNFLSLNINKSQAWKKLDVRSIPTLLYFKEGILRARQDNFPDKEEIVAQLKNLLGKRSDFIREIRKSIEAEYIISHFYKYISEESKNGKVRSIFSKFNKESREHQRLLEGRFQDVTGQNYELNPDKFQSKDLRPHSFSLEGALKTAIQAEQNAFKFYRLASRKSTSQVRKTFERLVREETRLFNILKKELRFVRIKETFSSLGKVNYYKWMGQIWK